MTEDSINNLMKQAILKKDEHLMRKIIIEGMQAFLEDS